VSPVDLLAFLVSAPGVVDGNLEDARPSLGQLDRQLGFDAKVQTLERDTLKQAGTHHLVAGFHVGEVQVADQVAEKREELVTELVPKEEHAPELGGQEAGAEDRVG